MWMSELVYALAFTTITGALLTGIWFLAGRLLERLGFISVAYRLLKTLACFWLLPIAYCVLKWLNLQLYRWQGFLFLPTPFLSMAGKIFFGLWVVVAAAVFCFYLRERVCLHKRLAVSAVCEDGRILDSFAKILEELKIPGAKAVLRISEYETIPFTAGIFHPVIILPACNYGEHELEIIFRHELAHVLHKDVFYKNVAYLICILHAANPFAWWYFCLLQNWSEYAVDDAVCRGTGKFADYYENILCLMQGGRKTVGSVSGLAGGKSAIRKRIEHVKRAYLVKKRSRLAAAFAIVLLLFTGTGSVSAASLSAADVLAAAVRRAGIYLAGSSDQTWEEYITVEGTVSAGYESPWKNSFSWKIPACIQTVGPEIHLKKGQSVSVLLETDSPGKEVSCGLFQPDGSSRYIIRNGQAEHSFYIEESGVYKFFVLNKGETRVNVHGSYSTR